MVVGYAKQKKVSSPDRILSLALPARVIWWNGEIFPVTCGEDPSVDIIEYDLSLSRRRLRNEGGTFCKFMLSSTHSTFSTSLAADMTSCDAQISGPTKAERARSLRLS